MSVEEEDRALGLGDQINVSEAFIDDDRKEAGPPEETPCRVTDAHIRRHKQE